VCCFSRYGILSTNDFIRCDNDRRRGAKQERDFAASDIETSPTMGETNDLVSKDYWFGKKYFECILAQDLVRCTPLEEPVSSIDV
jgi:hypothetical protein